MKAHLRCNTCGSQPCVNPGFCAACRAADRRLAIARGNAALPPPPEPPRDFASLPVSQWSEQEAFLHLKGTFDQACRFWPDVMEPHVTLLADTDDIETQQTIMRVGLQTTFWQRMTPIPGIHGT